MDAIILLLILMSSLLLILTPPAAVWRCLSQQTSGRAAWLYPMLAMIGPLITVYVLMVLMWLPAYSGQCGGWLGETTPCSGFGQYATETMFWAAMTVAMPGVIGILLGVAVLIFRLIRRNIFRPAS